MDHERFDHLVRIMGAGRGSRRAVTAFAGGLLAGALGRPAVEEVAAATSCRRDGAGCDPQRAKECCSGLCRKRGRRFRCARLRAALGCTNLARTDACAGENADNPPPCPGNPDGFCVVDERARPLCAGDGDCFRCQEDEDCFAEFGAAARCITQCQICNGQTNGRACVVPVGAVDPEQPLAARTRGPFGGAEHERR